MKNVVLENIGKLSDVTDKLFEKEKLGLTGMEISINNLAANEGNPFVHTHQQNEELYIVIKGSGVFYADGEEFGVQEGSLIRVEPEAERAIAAGGQGIDGLFLLEYRLIYFNGCEQAEYIRKGCQREFPVCQAMKGGIAS